MNPQTQLKLNSSTIWGGCILVGLAATGVILRSFGQQSMLFMVYLMMVTFSLTHGSMRYGVKRMLTFTVLILVISWGYETLSIKTGFPFGHYHYSEKFYGPWVGVVPFMIMPAYFSMGYMSWTIGHILLDKRNAAINGIEIITVPVMSAFVMVMWDMCFDPNASTIKGFYDWHEGGAYFGVPFSNYMGWYLCVFTFYFVFALILSKDKKTPDVIVLNRPFWILPALMYATRCIEYVINALTAESKKVVSHDGHIWWSGDITNSLLLVSIFTMMFICFYALVRIIISKDLNK